VGSYTHHPNVEAAVWLVDCVMPRVWEKAPEARLRLVGPGLAAGAKRRLCAPRVALPGRVEDLASEYREAAVFASPIRSGGGMRGKVLEAMACGRPVVSTRLGLEGIEARPGRHALLADSAESFAAAILALLEDPSRRRALGRAARELVEARYDARVVFERYEAELEAAHGRRSETEGPEAGGG